MTDYQALINLFNHFSNCFDLKDWDGLRDCLAEEVYTDYSDLRGTPPETMSNAHYAELRKQALAPLATHHLMGNHEIELTGDTAQAQVSAVIFRRSGDDQVLNTHCIYRFGAARIGGQWRITRIVQKVLWSDGKRDIHAGITQR